MRHLVSAERLEKAAEQHVPHPEGAGRHASRAAAQDDPQSERVRRIAKELLPHAEKWNPRAKDWQWDVVVIKSKTINAFCMPARKIAFFTGILETLNS